MTDTEQYWIDQYHEVAERLRKVSAERDALLRDCWEACGGKGPDSSDDELVGTISTMRVGLDRLRAQLDAGTEAGWHALRNERDALRARIEDAPFVIVHDSGYVGRTVSYHLLFEDEEKAKVNAKLKGKRVALVVLGDDE